MQGDCLWYMAANIEKLMTRYPNGYTAADSVRRVDMRPDEAKTTADSNKGI